MSDERWQLILDATHDGIWDWDLTTDTLFFSPRWKTMLGYKDEELPNHFETWKRLLHSQDKERVFSTLQRYLNQEIPTYSLEFRLKTKRGSYKWILSQGKAQWDETGKPIRMAGSHSDISDRKEAEEALALEKSLVRSLIDCIPDPIFYKDHRGIYLSCNQAFKELVGKEEIDIIGATDFDLFPPEIANFIREQDRLMIEQNAPRRNEEWLSYPDGTRCLFDTFKTPLMDAGGILLGLMGISRDISDRLLKEQALQQKAKQDRLLSHISRQLIDQDIKPAINYTLEAIGEFTDSLYAYIIHYSPCQQRWSMKYEWYRSPMGSRLQQSQNLSVDRFSWFSRQLLQGECLRINQIEDLPVEAIAERETFLQSQSPLLLVVPMITKGQTFGYIALERESQKQWTEEEEQFLQLVGELTAIAQTRHEAEISLKQAKEAADSANRAKSEFLTNMSHELRTPLNAILGFTQVLHRDPNLNEEQREQLSIINRSGEHLLDLINDILEMSKIEAGRTTYNADSFDLYHLLDSLEEMLRLKAEAKGLQLIVERTSEIPQYIKTDEGKLRQVLINLLGNAIKFTDEGGVTLRVKLTEAQTNSYTFLFEVEDTGFGIATEEIEQLFEAFTQTETGRNSQQGTGLGLPISQKFVELMGGQIKVQSIIGSGSLFSFTIKAQLADVSHIKKSKSTRKVIGLAPNQPKYRILAVDDRPESRLLLLKLLLSMGFEVQEASNGQEAIAIWDSWEPHLIWMDMRMPVMDGYEAARQIKSTLKGQATVIVALTASAFEEDRHLVLSAGCDDFMRKPFKEEDLWEKMAQHLGIAYIYAENAPDLPAQLPSASDADMIEQLAQLSEEWREQLYQASLECSDDQILTLIAEIPPELSILKEKLQQLAENFLFETILDWLSPILNS